jgi:alpha-amylase
MGVCYHAHARFLDAHGNKITLPAPWDKGEDIPCHYDWIAENAPMLKSVGFTALLQPPPEKTISGRYNNADGYGAYDHGDIGSKNQYGAVETRFGTREENGRSVGVCHRVGLDVYTDMVFHQVMGGRNGTYEILNSDGKTFTIRWTPGNFRGDPPRSPEDPVPSVVFDFSFGDEFVYKNCVPHNFTYNWMIQWAEWLFASLDYDGSRVDDVKGTWVGFIWQVLRSGNLANKFMISEYFDGNDGTIDDWAVRQMGRRSCMFDFNGHFQLQAVCDHNASMRVLDGAGYASVNSLLAGTFMDNPDTDLSFGENITSNKLLGYAYLLTVLGYPFIYHKDYWIGPGCYGLKPWLDVMIWIHENLAFGDIKTQYVTDDILVINRFGGPGLLTILNKNPFNDEWVSCPTGFGPHVELHEYSGNYGNIWTDANGWIHVLARHNTNQSGQCYLFFSRTGYSQPFNLQGRSTTQRLHGNAYLDIPVAPPNATLDVWPRIWADGAHPITIAPQGAHPDISFSLLDPTGAIVGFTHNAIHHPGPSGYYTLRVSNTDVVEHDFCVDVTYTGTVGIQKSQWAKFSPVTGVELDAASSHIELAAQHLENRLTRRQRKT